MAVKPPQSLFQQIVAAPVGIRWADEAFFIYAMMVVAKQADHTKVRLERILRDRERSDLRDFFYRMVKSEQAPTLLDYLKLIRTGQYERLHKGFTQWALHGPDMASKSLTVSDLEAIHGCGPKTARFFMLYRRPKIRVAVLDTHVLKFLADCRVPLVPLLTPGIGETYRRLEREVLTRADALGLAPRELDDRIWRHFARGEAVGYDDLIEQLGLLGLIHSRRKRRDNK